MDNFNVTITRNEVTGCSEIDLNTLMEENLTLFESLINNPEEVLDKIKESLVVHNSIKIVNLPDSLKKKISQLRSSDMGNLIKLSGILKKVIQPTSKIERIDFACPSCGTIQYIIQDKNKILEPTRCSCGRRGGFKQVREHLIDIQEMELEEDTEDIGSKQPQKIKILLENGLTNPDFSKFQIGNKVDIIGILQKIPLYLLRKDIEQTVLEYMIKVIEIIPHDGYDDDIKLNEEEINQIKEIAKGNPLLTLSENLAPGIIGLEHIKKSMVLFAAKGVTRYNGTERERGDIHTLFLGDAGLGKTSLATNLKNRLFNCRVADGKDASKAGIIATVSKDKMTERWGVEAGDIVLANRGFLIIDECFPKDTEILTEGGFIKFQNLEKDTKVGQYKEDGTIEFVLPERIIKKPFEGNLLKVKSFFGEHISTPNHNRVLVNKKGEIKKLKVMDSLLTSDKVIINGEYDGKGVNLSDNELRFIVAFNADGCIKNKKYGYLSIKKERKKERIKKICKELNIKYSVREYIRKNKGKYCDFYFGDIIKKYFNSINGKYTKEYPKNWFKELSLRQRKLIIKELEFWDGYKCSKNSWQFFTSKEEDVKIISEIAITAGFSCHIYRRKKSGYKDNFSLTFKEKRYKTQQNRKVTEIPYKDDVYCVTVPTGMILIKQGDCFQVTGNCDKLSQTDRDALHGPMESGYVDVSKAGVHARMMANTSILALANPKGGKVDKRRPIIDQLDFTPTLLSRFDLIFVLVDKPNEEEDRAVSKRILKRELLGEGKLSPEFIKKYFYYVSKLKPTLTEETAELISNYYTKIRKLSVREGEFIGMPITKRALKGLLRLSEAHAKIRLSEVVEPEDFEIAKELFNISLSDFGINLEDGGIVDLSSITTRIKMNKKDRYYQILGILKDMAKIKNEFNKEEFINTLKDKLGFAYKDGLEFYDILHKEGDICELNYENFRLVKTD